MEKGRRAVGKDLGRQRPQGRRRSGRRHEGAQGPAREIQCGVLKRAPIGWAASIWVSSPAKAGDPVASMPCGKRCRAQSKFCGYWIARFRACEKISNSSLYGVWFVKRRGLVV